MGYGCVFSPYNIVKTMVKSVPLGWDTLNGICAFIRFWRGAGSFSIGW
jgi:hypothetical protein